MGSFLFVLLVMQSALAADDSGNSNPTGIVVYGQNGILLSGPKGFSMVVPDQSGTLKSVPLSSAIGPATPAVPGITTPDEAARQAALEQQREQEAQTQAAGQAPAVPQSLVCECHCPPCPAAGVASPSSPDTPSDTGNRPGTAAPYPQYGDPDLYGPQPLPS